MLQFSLGADDMVTWRCRRDMRPDEATPICHMPDKVTIPKFKHVVTEEH